MKKNKQERHFQLGRLLLGNGDGNKERRDSKYKKMNKRDRWRKETVAGETIRATKCFGLHNEGYQNIISDQVLLTCMW